MISKFIKGRVYIFIDAANLENSVKSLNWWIDYRKLYKYFKENTNLIGIRHYCPSFKDLRQDNFFNSFKKYWF
ncbi:NYN domain-containing protein [Patescibacteria group bacterium]|nr:NYN domain-containing protein [Patescibacteria group bacterium]